MNYSKIRISPDQYNYLMSPLILCILCLMWIFVRQLLAWAGCIINSKNNNRKYLFQELKVYFRFIQVLLSLLVYLWLFYDGGPYHIEASPLICSANQWTVSYMIGTSVLKELINYHIDSNPARNLVRNYTNIRTKTDSKYSYHGPSREI